MVTARTEKKVYTCQHCGHRGPDVIWEWAYIGGLGYDDVYHCTDIDACLKRAEAKNEQA